MRGQGIGYGVCEKRGRRTDGALENHAPVKRIRRIEAAQPRTYHEANPLGIVHGRARPESIGHRIEHRGVKHA